MQAGEIAVALLHAENEALALVFLFKLGCDLADIFEAGQTVADFAAVAFRHAVNERGSDERLDYNGIFRQSARRFHRREDIFGQQNADFVAAHELIAVTGVDGDTDSVAVGVGCKEQVRFFILRKLQRLFKRLADFGVRIGAGRKVTVRVLLRRNYRNIVKARALENLADGLVARAVQRSVYEL